MAFWQLEPFGSQFDEFQSALVASIIAEVNRNRKKRGSAYTPQEFMQEWGKDDPSKREKPQSGEAMFAFIQNMQAEMEMRAGKRAPQDLHATVLLDQHGEPYK